MRGEEILKIDLRGVERQMANVKSRVQDDSRAQTSCWFKLLPPFGFQIIIESPSTEDLPEFDSDKYLLRIRLQSIRPNANAISELVSGHHSMPSRFCMCSSGTPLVSGIMNFTQTSCSIIMPQKRQKT